MNDYQKGRMRRKELERRQQQIVADAEASRSRRRRVAVLAAMIVAALAAIFVVAPMRFKAIASNDLDDVEQYLIANLDDSIVGAGSVIEAQAEQQESEQNGFFMFAESISNTNESAVDTTDKVVLAKYLLVDRELVQDGMTIEDVYASEEFAESAVISQYANTMPLLDPGEGSQYYVAMLDTAQFNGYGTIIDAAFAWTNTLGQSIDDVIYDKEAGIAYVPKYLFDTYNEEDVDPSCPVSAQLLVSYDLSAQTTDMAQVEIPLRVTSENYNARPTEATSFTASSFDTSITFPVVMPEDASKIGKENLLVCEGGSDFPIYLGDENSSYDSETGELTIALNGLTVTSINVTVLSDDLVTSFIDTVTQPSEADAVAAADMVTWPKGALSNLSSTDFDTAVKGKTVYKYNSKVLRFTQSNSNFSGFTAIDKAYQKEAREASKYVYGGNGTKNAETVADIVQGDGLKAVASDNGLTRNSKGRGYYWNESGGINEAFAFPGSAGVSATVAASTVVRGSKVALDLSGIQSVCGSEHIVGAGLCSHIEKSNEASQQDENILNNKSATYHVQDTYVVMRPLYRDPKNQYVIIAFIGARLSTQSGVGVYKFRLQQPGYANLVKTSSNGNVTNGNEAYSLAGAKYGVYKSEDDAKNNKNPVGTLTTGADGKSNTISVKPDRYYAKEIEAPAGFKLNQGVIGPIPVAEGKTGTFEASDEPLMGTISVKKQDAETGKGLSGGTYKMTLYAADKKTALKSVEITKDETVSFGTYGFGTYYVHEDSATFPYMTEEFAVDANTAWHAVKLDSSNQTITVTISDQQRRGEVILNKTNDAGEPVEGASFFLYADQDVTSLDGTPRHKKDQKITVKQNAVGDYTFDPASQDDELYTDAQGHIKVSGLYLTAEATSFRMVEEKPAPGYLLDSTPVVFSLAKDETVKVITASQGKVNHENGIDIYTYEELEGETPEGPDIPVPNKFVGVWKESDAMVVETADGTNSIAIRTPNGEAQYRPTLVPTDEEIPQGKSRVDDGDSKKSEGTASAEAVSGQSLELKALDGNSVNISDADAKELDDAKASIAIDGKTIGRLVPRSGSYQVTFPTLEALQVGGKAPSCSAVPGWSYKSSQPKHDVKATTVTNTLTLTHGSNTYTYTITYVVADGTQQGGGNDQTPKDEDPEEQAPEDQTPEEQAPKNEEEAPADRQSLQTIVAEWDANQNAWIAKGLAPNTAYKVIISSKMVAVTPSDLSAGHTLYARYALEASEFFPKGWVDQAGLPKDDSLYVYKGMTDANAHIAFNRIPAGRYQISEIKPPVDESGNFTYLADRRLHVFKVDEKTGLIKDVDDLTTGNHTEASGIPSQRQAFIIREAKTHLLISKRSSETGKDVTGAQLILTNEAHFVIDQWTSDGSPHAIDGLTAGTYYLSEVITPQNYDKATTVIVKLKPISTPQTVVMYDAPIVVGVGVDKRQEIADPLDERYMENGDGKNNAKLSADKLGFYDYSIDARSTANSWIDELTVTDEPKAVTDGMARIMSISTPQAWQDYDGKMNVWYKTNKSAPSEKAPATEPEKDSEPTTAADETETDEGEEDTEENGASEDETGRNTNTTQSGSNANATLSDGHDNPWLAKAGGSGLDADGDKRVEDYTGWNLWREGLPTMVSTTLQVSELSLPEGEYVTGVRFEYGRVEMGFTTRPTDWDRELLKNEHDDVDDILGVDRMTFEAADASADAAVSKLTTLVNGFATDASRAAESVVAKRTEDEEAAYQRLIQEVEEYNNSLAPDSTLPRKFIEAPEMPAYLGDDDAVTKLTTARDSAKISIRAIFETANTPEGKVALSEALPGLKALVSGATSDDTATMIDQKVQDLSAAITAADADSMAAIQASLIEDLDRAVDEIINTGLSGRVHYAPAIVHMQLTDKYVAGTSLANGASAIAARNGGGASDSDGTDQAPKTPETPETPETSDDEDSDSNENPGKTENYPLFSKDTDKNFQSAKDRVIELDTNLALPDGSKTLTVESGQINIIDHVNLSGLTPGKEYVLVGEIHSRMGTQDDGFVDAGVVKNNAGENVTSVMPFTPTSESTSVDVPFTIDVEQLNAYPAVAFEELHESVNGQPGEIVLAEHKDISDADQTINLDSVHGDVIVPEQVRRMFRGTPLAQTGDAVLIGGVAAIATASVVGIALWRRRRNA